MGQELGWALGKEGESWEGKVGREAKGRVSGVVQGAGFPCECHGKVRTTHLFTMPKACTFQREEWFLGGHVGPLGGV